MVQINRWLRRWWWTFLLGAAAVGGIFVTILATRRSSGAAGGGAEPIEPPTPTFRERAEQEVERVRLEGEVEKARVTARADSQREELDRIEEVGKEDPAEARRRIATWLRENL